MPIWWVAGGGTFNWLAAAVGAAILYSLWGPGCEACIQQYNNPYNF